MSPWAIFSIFLLLLVGCQKTDQPRQYIELVSADTTSSVASSNVSVESSPYTWILPPGWKQDPHKDGMRLASFYIEKDPDAIDCYIVSLPGMAGGTEANVKRWMTQISIDPSDANYQKLINQAQTIDTTGGLQAHVYDLMSVQHAPSDKSMIAAIIAIDDTTLFLKMTGTSDHVRQKTQAFLELLKSISVNHHAQTP